jgi:hypothetical protein
MNQFSRSIFLKKTFSQRQKMIQNLFKKPLKIFVFCVLVFISFGVKAGESPFGFIYTTDLMPKEKLEFEQRSTFQDGQSQGDYNSVLMRSELEYGITDNFQIAGYLNYDYVAAKNNDVNGQTSSELIPTNHNPSKSYKAWTYRSTAVEFIYRILSPYKDPFGLALYFEPYYGKRVREYEGRLILQKNFLDDSLIFAANIVAEYEKEKFAGAFGAAKDDEYYSSQWSKMVKFDTYLGVSYRFASRWAAGLEYRLHNDYDGHRISRSNHTQIAHFVGPTLHYARKEFFTTLALLYQVSGKGLNTNEKSNTVGGRIYGDHANVEALRLTIGVPF